MIPQFHAAYTAPAVRESFLRYLCLPLSSSCTRLSKGALLLAISIHINDLFSATLDLIEHSPFVILDHKGLFECIRGHIHHIERPLACANNQSFSPHTGAATYLTYGSPSRAVGQSWTHSPTYYPPQTNHATWCGTPSWRLHVTTGHYRGHRISTHRHTQAEPQPDSAWRIWINTHGS